MNENDLRRELARGNYEETEEGLYFPKAKIIGRGQFVYSKRGEPEEYSENLLVDEGLDHILDVALRNATQLSTWYIALFSGNVTVLSTWDASNFAANATEITAYTSSTRVAWTPAAVSGGEISSYTAKAEFTANAPITVRGAALLSSSVKGGTTGVLIGASRFGSDKLLSDTEILDVGYKVQLVAA